MLALLWIPGCLGGLAAVLAATVLVEQHVLSPRAFVVRAVRSRRVTPERAESALAAHLASLADLRR